MPIRPYLKGPVFGPDTLLTMGLAFEVAAADLKLPPTEEAKRETLAHIVVELGRSDEELDVDEMSKRAAAFRERAH
jgi:hypothetical protein